MVQHTRRSVSLWAYLLLGLLLAALLLRATEPVQGQSAWAPNTYYAVGALVTYGGSTYKCLQAHTSQVGWEPPSTPALWQLQSGTVPTATRTSTTGTGPTATRTRTPTTGTGPTATRTRTPTTGTAPTRTPTSSGGTTIYVSTATQLHSALAAARPGQTIQLADGTYSGQFKITLSGSSTARITLRGSRSAILASNGGGYVLHLQNASYWTLQGFTMTNGQKGLMLDGANNNLIDGVRVHAIGQEGVHFRTHSSYNTIQNSVVENTGTQTAGYGEGVYIGSAVSNWGTYTGGQPDRSDYNKVINNRIGPNVRAEHIDVKEGTTSGEIRGNTFDGNGMSGQHYADSWIDMKGNNYLIISNRGTNTILDGFQTHKAVEGWGCNNTFRGNTAAVNAPGYGFSIQLANCGNRVYTDNTVTGAGKGVANIPLSS